jgi:hypothetical protein
MTTKKTAEDFLIERNIVIKGATSFPLNLTRDTHMQSKRDIVQAMEDYAEYKHSFLSNVNTRFMLFRIVEYYPSGGMSDCTGKYETLQQAKEAIKEKGYYEDYYVYDRWIDEVVFSDEA